MLDISLFQALVVFAVAGIIGILLHRHLQQLAQNVPAAPPLQPDDSPENETLSTGGTPWWIIPVPKTMQYFLGLVFSILVAAAIALLPYWVVTKILPPLIGFIVLGYALFGTMSLLGLLVGAWIYIEGFRQMESVRIGFAGVPIIFNGRWRPFWLELYYPEGDVWGIPGVMGRREVDLKGRPLIENKQDPSKEEVSIAALARAEPFDPTTPAGQLSPTIEQSKQVFSIPVSVTVAVRIRTYRPWLYLSYDNVEGLLYQALERRVREFIRKDVHDAFCLPDLKDELTKHLEKALDEDAREMGVDFIKLFVTKIEPPVQMQNAGADYVATIVERTKDLYRAETLEKMVKQIKDLFPGLEPLELKGLALSMMNLATTQVYSVEGQRGAFSVLPLGGKKGG